MLTGNSYIDGLIITSFVIGAVGVIWKKVLGPVIHAIVTIERLLPVVVTIAEQFEANGGSSLRDTIDRSESEIGAIKATVGEIQATVGEQGEKLDQLHNYAHDNNHRLNGSLAQLVESYGELATQARNRNGQ